MVTFTVRSLARGAFLLPERLLHGWRRRAAMEALRHRPRPRTLLFVCHGNICRSPYAEAVARKRFPAAIGVESAGFIGPDRPSPLEAVAVAAERGVDLSAHRSQVLELGHLRDVDLVLVMDRGQRHRLVAARPELADKILLLGDLDPEPVTHRAIPDPVEKPAPVFKACYARIDRCVDALAELWGEDPGDDAQPQGSSLEGGRRSEAHK